MAQNELHTTIADQRTLDMLFSSVSVNLTWSNGGRGSASPACKPLVLRRPCGDFARYIRLPYYYHAKHSCEDTEDDIVGDMVSHTQNRLICDLWRTVAQHSNVKLNL